MLTVTHVAFDYLRSKSILIPRLSDIIRREIDALAPTPEREHAIEWTTERARVSGLLEQIVKERSGGHPAMTKIFMYCMMAWQASLLVM